MQITICDDQKTELLRISKLLDKYLCSQTNQNNFDVHCFGSSRDLLRQIENGKRYDIFLLDVVMPELNGIQLATKIRAKDEIAKIIFLTSSAEFAVDSYAVDAFNYLLKPVQEKELFKVLKKALLHTNANKNNYIIVKTQACLEKVFLCKLIYVEIIGRTIYFHQLDEPVIESRGTFSEIEPLLLKDKRFVKPHRSYIINLDYIKTLSFDELITTNDLLIPVSRKCSKALKQNYIKHSFGDNIQK